ncbi:MAG TPA: flagellar motor switch protein FliM [Anaerolineaceae bacterium]
MLSQAEIDALLSGAIEIEAREGEGGVNLAEIMGQAPAAGGAGSPGAQKEPTTDKKVQAYNFWSPDRFSKEQMRAVELMHEDLAERLANSLPSFFRTSLRPRLVHSEQGRFHDFIKDLPPSTLFHMITLAPLPGQMVVTMSPNLSYIILEQRLGGKVEGKWKDRTLTDIDQALLRGMVEHMLNDIKAAWAKVVTVEPGLEDSTVNQHWVQMLMGNDRVMLLTFELAIQYVTGTMDFFIPFGMLKPIANVLNPTVWITGRKEKQTDPAARQTLLQSVSHVKMPVRVFLGNAQITMREMLNLKVGDVLQLDTAINQELVVQVAKRDLFKGKVGRSGKNLAVQVTSAVKSAGGSSKE